jgi:ribosomal protein S27AE
MAMQRVPGERERPSPAVAPDAIPHPDCEVCGGGLIRVEHQESSRGRTYDRFFCPRCGYAVEVLGSDPPPDGRPAV